MRITASNGDANDYCLSCAPTEEEAKKTYGTGDIGQSDRGDCYCYDDAAPPYHLDDPNEKTCKDCGDILTRIDNTHFQ